MDVILWKTMLFDKHYQSFFLVSYWIASLGITKIYIFSKYFWSPCSTDDNHYSFVFCWVLFFQWPQAFGITLMYFWKHVRLSNKRSLVCKKLGRHFLSDMIFFLGCVWQILYFIKTELPLNIKGNAIWNNPLQDTVLLYSIFAKYIIRIFLLIW